MVCDFDISTPNTRKYFTKIILFIYDFKILGQEPLTFPSLSYFDYKLIIIESYNGLDWK